MAGGYPLQTGGSRRLRFLHREDADWARRFKVRSVRAQVAGLNALVVDPGGTSDGRPSRTVLYLLHGSGHSPSTFLPLLRDALPETAGVLLVLPEGGKSWYLDALRERWEPRFLRLVAWVERSFDAACDRSGRGICGFSMGGYGAMRLAAAHPELFGSASSILGLLDIVPLLGEHPALSRLLGTDERAWVAHNPADRVAALATTRLLVTTGRRGLRPLVERALRCAVPPGGRAGGVRVRLGRPRS